MTSRSGLGSVLIVTHRQYPSSVGLSRRIDGLLRLSKGSRMRTFVTSPYYDSEYPKTPGVSYADLRSLAGIGTHSTAFWSCLLLIFSILALTRTPRLPLTKRLFVQYQGVYSFLPAYMLKLFYGRGTTLVGDDIILLHLGRAGSKWFHRLTELLAVAVSDAVATPSEFAYAFLRRRFPSKKVVYVPNGTFFEAKRARELVPEAIFVGSMRFDQNRNAVGSIVRIARELSTRGCGFPIWVVGGPTESIHDIISAKNTGRVSFLGNVSPQQLTRLYESAGVGLLPFFGPDSSVGGQRIKALEYFANGLLVVGSQAGIVGMPDLVPGRHYVEVSSASHMTNVLIAIHENPSSYTNIAATGSRFVCRRYSWDRVLVPYFRDVLA